MISEERKLIRLRIGESLKKVRLENNISIKKLSSILNVNQKTIINWEKGKTALNSKFLLKFSTFYNMKIDDLLGLDKIKRPKK